MFSRSLALLISPWLPCAALILPFGHAHTVNALVAGTLAVALSGFSLSSRRAGSLVSAIGIWVALTGFIFPSTLLEEVVVVSWGAVMFICMFAPFREPGQATAAVAALPVATTNTRASVPVQRGVPVAA
jgi:hypothetical protein